MQIPSAIQQPVTRREAYAIIAPIQSILDTMDASVVAAIGDAKGDSAARRTAAKEIRKQAEEQIRATVDEIEAMYGPYAPKVLAFAIAESVRDKEIGDIASSALFAAHQLVASACSGRKASLTVGRAGATWTPSVCAGALHTAMSLQPFATGRWP